MRILITLFLMIWEVCSTLHSYRLNDFTCGKSEQTVSVTIDLVRCVPTGPMALRALLPLHQAACVLLFEQRAILTRRFWDVWISFWQR